LGFQGKAGNSIESIIINDYIKLSPERNHRKRGESGGKVDQVLTKQLIPNRLFSPPSLLYCHLYLCPC
jgi:hypothetical protein